MDFHPPIWSIRSIGHSTALRRSMNVCLRQCAVRPSKSFFSHLFQGHTAASNKYHLCDRYKAHSTTTTSTTILYPLTKTEQYQYVRLNFGAQERTSYFIYLYLITYTYFQYEIIKRSRKRCSWCIVKWLLSATSRCGGRSVSFFSFRSAKLEWGWRGNLSPRLYDNIDASFVLRLKCLVENRAGKLRWDLRSLTTHKHQWSK